MTSVKANKKHMAIKQRWWRPRLPDSMVDPIIKKLTAKWELKTESELITKLLLDADKKVK
jgi:hypothetical protein